MSELWLRLVLVAGVLAVVGVIVLIRRRRANASVRTVKARGTAAGVYFFSAASCSTCDLARDKLISRLGQDGYTEFTWEQHAQEFADYGVDQVPAVMIVDHRERGRLHLGQPDRALIR